MKTLLRAATWALLLTTIAAPSFAANSSAPQFVAKLYTEAFGRAPDSSGFPFWSGSVRSASFLTGYSSTTRISGAWSDGITVDCEGATVQYNDIVDTTDASIVLFPGRNGSAQVGSIRYNRVVSAGNNTFFGIAFEPFIHNGAPFQIPRVFAGAAIESNEVFSSDMSHFHTAYEAGTQLLWLPRSPLVDFSWEPGNCSPACTMIGNTFSGRAGIALGLHGMTGVNVSGNSHTVTGVPSNSELVIGPGPSTWSCTKSTAANPIICANGSTNCPVGGVVAAVYEHCM